jgi:hypothetical protein
LTAITITTRGILMVKRSAFWSLVAVAVGVFAWPTSAQDIPNPPDLWTESSADVGIKSSQASEWSIGTADFRISDMGGTGDTAFGGRSPSVAYNSTDNEFLVVWWGDDNEGGLVDDEHEIFGQLIDAATGVEIGTNDFRISIMGGTGDPAYPALDPSVAYNPTNNEYLVVWSGQDNLGGLVSVPSLA